MRGFLLLALLFLVACKPQWKEFNVPEREIVGVYYHGIGDYTVAIQDGDYVSMVSMPHHPNSTNSLPVNIIADVSENEPMWYKCEGKVDTSFGSTTKSKGNVVGGCEIHIRGLDNIVGGPWNKGKFGS